LTRRAGRADDNAALHSDAHHHLTVDDRAVAGGTHEDALVFQRHGFIAAVGRRRWKCQRGGALADVEERTFDIRLRVGDWLRLPLRGAREEACDLVFQRRRPRRCRSRRLSGASRRRSWRGGRGSRGRRPDAAAAASSEQQ
jgi:hypothetical protein